VARELGLNRGTVGRHIRRAEQHLVEWAISHPAR
jgi:predicted DNA binding protein